MDSASSQNTMTLSGTNIMNALTIQRINKARQAMMRAENPKFRQYWHNVAMTLQSQLVSENG